MESETIWKVAGSALFYLGTLSPNPWDLSLRARMAARLAGRLAPPRAIPAAESALRSHPCVAASSAQVRSV